MSGYTSRGARFIAEASNEVDKDHAAEATAFRQEQTDQVGTALTEASTELGRNIYGYPEAGIRAGLLKAIREILPTIRSFTEIDPLTLALGSQTDTVTARGHVPVREGNATTARKIPVAWDQSPVVKHTLTPLAAAEKSLGEIQVVVHFPPQDLRTRTRCSVVVGFTPEGTPKAFYVEHKSRG